MKNLIVILLLTLAAPGVAQKTTIVPQKTKDTFSKTYPNAKGVKWTREASDFEASFTQQKEELSVVIDADGKIKEVETLIDKSTLPEAVRNALAKDFNQYKIMEAARIVANGVTLFEAEVKKGKEKYDLLFSADGTLTKKITTN